MRNSIVISLLLFPLIALAQKQIENRIYLDSVYKETDDKNYSYYKIVNEREDGTFEINTFDKNERLRSSVYSKKKSGSDFSESIWFHENGNKKSHSTRNGATLVEKFFHDNGTFAFQPEYVTENGKIKPVLNQYFDRDGNQTVKDGEGICTINELTCETSGKIIKGTREGEWTGKIHKTGHTFTEKYRNGVVVSGELTDENGKKYFYSSPVELPSFGNNPNDFAKFVQKNFKKPRNLPVSGTIFMNFIVDRNGRPTNIKILRGLGIEVDQEAIRIIKTYNKWTPGKMRGIPMDVAYNLPLRVDFQN